MKNSLATSRAFASAIFLATMALFMWNGSPRAQTADSLPAFKSDSAETDPFRKVEAGPSPWSANPTASAPKTKGDSLARTDTVTERLRKRRPAVSAYLGVDFIDFDAKALFKSSLEAHRTRDSLQLLQDYESVHLAFPVGIQAVLPVTGYMDVVAKTHSYWYKQTAILGDKNKRHAGDEWFAVQANLGGLGLRYYIPPSLLSVTGGLGIYVQGLVYWNLGNSQLYSPYGSADAGFEPAGSAYELQFGMQQALTGPWKLSGSIGYLQQDFKSESAWSDIVKYSPPPGKAVWGSSAIQASLSLWYHFGAVPDTAAKPGARPLPTGQGAPNDPNAPSGPGNPAGILPGGSQPQGTPPAGVPDKPTTPVPAPVPAGSAPADSTRRF
jgi:hypothetical protein